MKLLVTGGAGFIGSNFVRYVLRDHPEDQVVVLDKLTYAGRPENLADHEDNPNYKFIHGAIEDREIVAEAVEGVDAIINFAAESHVDRSIEEPDAFITTDVFGTQVLLEAARENKIGRYLQISTDEVYGSIDEGTFTEESPIDPSSPYSASKAGGDMLVQAYHRTYGLPALITRASNNYGPYHYPEKLIPLCVLNAFAGIKLPVYGDGMQVRNWLYVEDHCTGIYTALTKGVEGEIYNIGGPDECPNIEVVKRIVELTGNDESLIEYVKDRPGHDVRYSLSSEKIRKLGWEPQMHFAEGLEQTVQWYRDNEWWWEPIRSGDYLEYYKRQYGSALES
jgi:dTDP-glucose 4,6-dehydratase